MALQLVRAPRNELTSRTGKSGIVEERPPAQGGIEHGVKQNQLGTGGTCHPLRSIEYGLLLILRLDDRRKDMVKLHPKYPGPPGLRFG
ncbi:MAG: hypothetical protein GX535_07715 [Xanthomonadaceae bacterium]|nr:hypothetical protein [Xanthomonadaceae bacterium]